MKFWGMLLIPMLLTVNAGSEEVLDPMPGEKRLANIFIADWKP